MSAPWKPGDPSRWSRLGFADPPGDGRELHRAQTADMLAYALVMRDARDPILGIIDAVRVELEAMAAVMPVSLGPSAQVLHLCGRRLEAAMALLERCDGTAAAPPEREWEDEETRDAAPTNDNSEPEGRAS
jgi:hypothetical protein